MDNGDDDQQLQQTQEDKEILKSLQVLTLSSPASDDEGDAEMKDESAITKTDVINNKEKEQGICIASTSNSNNNNSNSSTQQCTTASLLVHAEITYNQQLDRYLLTDLWSSNGPYLDGVKPSNKRKKQQQQQTQKQDKKRKHGEDPSDQPVVIGGPIGQGGGGAAAPANKRRRHALSSFIITAGISVDSGSSNPQAHETATAAVAAALNKTLNGTNGTFQLLLMKQLALAPRRGLICFNDRGNPPQEE